MPNNPSNLLTELEQIRAQLHQLATGVKSSAASLKEPTTFLSNTHLNNLCNTFAISHAERQVILLCLAAELILDFHLLCAQAQNNPQQSYPTLNLAQLLLESIDTDLLSPQSPIQYWKIIQLDKSLIFRYCPL